MPVPLCPWSEPQLLVEMMVDGRQRKLTLTSCLNWGIELIWYVCETRGVLNAAENHPERSNCE